MVAHQAGDHGLLMFAEAGDIRVAHEVLAVLMVPAHIHCEAHIVQQRPQFERYALRGSHFVQRSQLIEELSGQPPHVFAMARVRTVSPWRIARRRNPHTKPCATCFDEAS